MRIGIDIDDVLYPWSGNAHNACEEAGITNGNEITQWGMHLDYGCTSERLWEVIHAAYVDGMLLREPYSGVAETLSSLYPEHEIHLVTSRGCTGSEYDEMVRQDTEAWLAAYRIPHDSLTFTNDKCEVEADYFVDDNIGHVAAQMNRGTQAFLRSQPHNASATGMLRVADLQEFVATVRSETRLMDGVC